MTIAERIVFYIIGNACKMKSEVLPPHWMESVVAGAGVLTIILSNFQLESIASLTIVFVLGWFVQEIEAVRGIELEPKTSFRPHSNTGLLLGNLLIPMVVTASTPLWTNSTSSPLLNNYLLVTVVLSVFTPVAVLLCAMWKWQLTAEYQFAYQILILPVFALLVWSFWMRQRAATLIVLAVIAPILACFFLTRLLYFLPASFTLGEAVLVSESLTLLTMLAAASLTGGVGKLLACLQVLVLGCVIIGVVVSPVATKLQSFSHHHPLLKDEPSKDPADNRIASREAERSYLKLSLYFYACLVAAIVLVLLPWLGFLLGQEPLTWGIVFVTATKTRMLLLCLWVVLVIGAVGVVTLWGSSSTVTRKYFHLLAICIYVPGILYDVHLLHLASAGTLFIFIVLEFLRIFRVWPVGGVLHDALQVFVDDQDCGVAILTHIYLLLGMSLPVWLHLQTGGDGSQSSVSLALYSGVLSLGVGDSAASVVGSLCGKIRWPGSKKTVEGTCAAIASQLIACYLLFHLDPHLATSQRWAAITWVVCLTSILEAVTTQIDNLVLPLFMYSLLISL